MPLGGNFIDRRLDLFNDNLSHEFQQDGSRLYNVVSKESVRGARNYFDKIGVFSSQKKTSRLQDLIPEEETYERRLLTFEMFFASAAPDINDLMDMVANPTSDILKAMAKTLGRQMDAIILNAIAGTASVQTNNSVSNVALPNSQKIAVNDIVFDIGESAGDKGLTPGKLMKARKLLMERYAPEDLVVIAPAGQIMNIAAYARGSSADFISVRPLEAPSVQSALQGYLGLQFVQYEETGVDANLDERVFVISRSALKLGERQPITTKIAPLTSKVGFPEVLHSYFDAGAVRMYEEGVVEIACDPRKGV